MERDAGRPDDPSATRRTHVPWSRRWRSWRIFELEPPEGFADRVALAAGRRSRRRLAMTRAAGLREWARRAGGTRRRAVASSALLAGAVALGLEARHLRRTREMRAA